MVEKRVGKKKKTKIILKKSTRTSGVIQNVESLTKVKKPEKLSSPEIRSDNTVTMLALCNNPCN